MKFEAIFLATDKYSLESILSEDQFFDNYLFTDKEGFISLEAANFNSIDEIKELVKFLFPNTNISTELYSDLQITIFDLTNQIDSLLSDEKLEELYPSWLEVTKRENTMDEFGMLISFIGYIYRNRNKTHLLLIIKNENSVLM